MSDVNYHEMIGKRVWKRSKFNKNLSPKPFKSGRQINTVKEVVINPYTNNEAFSFIEDESVVDCKLCSLVPEDNKN